MDKKRLLELAGVEELGEGMHEDKMLWRSVDKILAVFVQEHTKLSKHMEADNGLANEMLKWLAHEIKQKELE